MDDLISAAYADIRQRFALIGSAAEDRKPRLRSKRRHPDEGRDPRQLATHRKLAENARYIF
jgi:hypothetical protein